MTDKLLRGEEKTVRGDVHSFLYIKKVYGYNKVCYRGLAKIMNCLHVLAAFSNMLMAKKYLPPQG